MRLSMIFVEYSDIIMVIIITKPTYIVTSRLYPEANYIYLNFILKIKLAKCQVILLCSSNTPPALTQNI